MVVNKRKKVTKYRGYTTHGGGHRKKRRGAGSRGGCGNAGTGKRAGHKKAGMKDRTLGQTGFLPRRKTIANVKFKAVNVSYFTPARVERLLAEGKAKKEGSVYVIDLKTLGYQKLLSTGNTNVKLKLMVKRSSEKAAGKISAAGGEIISSSEKAEKKSFQDKQEDKE